MNKLTMSILTLLLIPALAFADTGWQADLTQEVVIDPAILGMFGGMPGMEGGDSPESVPPGMGADPYGLSEPMISTYNIYFGNSILRMDMDLGVVKSTTLVDMANNVTYTFNDFEKVAHKLTVPDTEGLGGNPLGMSFMDPTDLYMVWDDLIEQYKTSEDMVVNELADTTIGGLTCKGISFAMTPEALEGMLAGVTGDLSGEELPEGDASGMEGMLQGLLAPLLGGGISGEIWISEGIEIPVLLRMDLGMTSISSSLANHSVWTPVPEMLAVPADYEIVEDQFGVDSLLEMPEFQGPPAPVQSV